VELKAGTLKSSGDSELFPPTSDATNLLLFWSAAILVFKAGFAEDAYCMAGNYLCGFLVALVAVFAMLALTQSSHHLFVRTWSFGSSYSYQCYVL
jgi:hypothetical protein